VHLDFEAADLARAVARAMAAGAALEQDVESKSWGRIAMFSDPFGNGFCLIEFIGRGYDAIALSGRQ
jgi:predicted enzyme related to lactoylglutathione lyase